MKIAILPNGHFKQTKNSVCVQNTTLFDAVFHVILCRLVDNEDLQKRTLQSIAAPSIRRFIETYLKHGATQQTLLARNNVLEGCFQIKRVGQMQTMDCTANVEKIVKFFLSKIFWVAKQKVHCRCGESTITQIPFLNIDEHLLSGIQRHQNINFSTTDPCKSCNDVASLTLHLNDMVFLVGDKIVLWENLPKVVHFQNVCYILSAIIEKTSQNHYVAHIMRPNNKWYAFDNSTKDVSSSNLKKRKMNFQLLCFCIPSIIKGNLMMTDYDFMYGQFVLQNFHTHVVDNTKVKIQNSCGPDSILHALMCIYVDMPALFLEIPEENDLIQLFSAYAKHNVTAIYNMRVRILKKLFQIQTSGDDSIIINCSSNIKIILDRAIQSTFPSVIISCDCGEQFDFSTVDVRYDDLSVHGLNNIRKCISLPKRLCIKCKKTMPSYSMGNVLFVDVQPISMEDKGIEIADEYIEITSIQNTLNFDNENYVLSSIINYHSEFEHYTVCCLRSNNSWYLFDDLKTTVHKAPSKVKPHILIFVKSSEASLLYECC